MKRLVVSLHDVHPGSFTAVRSQRDRLLTLGVDRAALLVIPDHHGHGTLASDPAFCGWLRERQAAGDEIVLHGFHHLRMGATAQTGPVFWTKFYTANEAEFLDLSFDDATALLTRGLARLHDAGLETQAFIAPAWLLGQAATRAVFALESDGHRAFDYTTSLREIRMRDGRGLRAHSLCWSARSAWRRVASLGWNAALWSRIRRQDLVRLALHPRDFEFPALQRQIERIISAAPHEGRGFANYRDVVALR